MSRYIPSMIVQRQTDKRKLKEYNERMLERESDIDPRKNEYHSFGQFDQAWIKPLIENEE